MKKLERKIDKTIDRTMKLLTADEHQQQHKMEKPFSSFKRQTVISRNQLRLDPASLKLDHALQTLVDYFNRDKDMTQAELANMRDTASRVAKAWRETTQTRTDIKLALEKILNVSFPTDNKIAGMITQGPIIINSWCPHHLLPVTYECYLSYIPKKKGQVVGLSKLSRIAQELGKRPILHEELAKDIADVLYKVRGVNWPGLKTSGSAVLLTGRHSCMEIRGVKSHALTSVTEIRGVFWQKGMEEKFNQAVEHIRNSKP